MLRDIIPHAGIFFSSASLLPARRLLNISLVYFSLCHSGGQQKWTGKNASRLLCHATVAVWWKWTGEAFSILHFHLSLQGTSYIVVYKTSLYSFMLLRFMLTPWTIMDRHKFLGSCPSLVENFITFIKLEPYNSHVFKHSHYSLWAKRHGTIVW